MALQFTNSITSLPTTGLSLAGNLTLSNLDQDALRLIDAMPTKPDSNRALLISNVFVNLKSANLYNKTPCLYMFAAHASDAAILNWVNPVSSQSAVLVNSPAFTVDRGYAGDGVSSHILTGVAPNTYANFTQDNGGFSTYINASGNTIAVIGNPNATNRLFFQPRTSGNIMTARINGTNTFTPVATNSDNTGFYTINRSGANNVEVYKNGALFEATTGNSSTAVQSQQNSIFRNDTTYSSRGVGAFLYHSSLNATEAATLRNILNNFFTAIGA